MITQELIDYVKTQLSSGAAREKIIADLLGQGGWSMEQINEVFTSIASVSGGRLDNKVNFGIAENKYWTKWIPGTNKVFMFLSLAVMFVIHPFILVTDALGLGEIALIFYGIMFVPLVIFGAFYRYENNKLSLQFKNTGSGIDPWLLILILIRNIVFGLNFIPFIQIFGAGALVFGIIPYLLIYYFLVRARNKSVAAV